MPKTFRNHSFKTKIDMPRRGRTELVTLLNARLADTFDLYSQIKQAHWNVKGKNFFPLHELFDKLAADVLPFVDEIAERATALGGYAAGTARMAAAASTLPEFPSDIVEGGAVLEALIERYAAWAASLRAAIDQADALHDKDTADLFTGISREADKQLWFLEAHVQA